MVTLSQLQNSAIHFSESPELFYKNIKAVAKSPVDVPVFLMAKKIFDGKKIRYCGKPLDQFPLTYEYLKNHSTELQERVNALILSITKAPKINDQVVGSIKTFLKQSQANTVSLNFALSEVTVIHIAGEEAQILKGKIDDLNDPSVYVALPLLIALRLLTQPEKFTEVNCPAIFSRTKAIQDLALKMSAETEAPLIDYLNHLRDKLTGLKPDVFKALEDRIYGTLASQQVEKNVETDECYGILSELSGMISRGERASAMNFCMELAILRDF
jgi:hypothetical protein